MARHTLRYLKLPYLPDRWNLPCGAELEAFGAAGERVLLKCYRRGWHVSPHRARLAGVRTRLSWPGEGTLLGTVPH